MSETATVHIDGAARGNPGPAAYALVLRRPGLPVHEESDTLGKATNNVAEYTALVRALEVAHELGVKKLEVFSDSELLVKQMNGEYRVKNSELQELYQEAQALKGKLERVTLTHIRRAQNADADRLCNEALDGRPRRPGSQTIEMPDSVKPATKVKSRAKKSSLSATTTELVPRAPEALEEEALALLNAVAHEWATHGLGHPNAVEVWDRLWTLLHEHNVVKR